MTHTEAITYAKASANQRGEQMAVILFMGYGRYDYVPQNEVCKDMQGWIQTDTINPEIH